MQQAQLAFGLFALCGFFAFLFGYAAVTGRHAGRYGVIDRHTAPKAFWFGQAIYAALVVMSAVFGFLTLP